MADINEIISKEAIDGLVKEAQSILLQARETNTKDKKQIEDLYSRIDKYLFTDNLRPALNESIAGLRGISDAMRTHAQRFLQWPWVKKNRQESVEKFQQLLQILTNYLEGLQNNFLPGGSGMLVNDLYEIKRILNDIRQNQAGNIELKDFIEKSEVDRSVVYKQYLILNGQLTETFEKIRTSIR